MRRPVMALLILSVLVSPMRVKALDCGDKGLWWSSAWERVPDRSVIPEEKQRRDTDARAALETLDRTPLVFRGRIVSTRYLSDPRKTNTPVRLLVFDQIEILKGRMPAASADGRAFVADYEWCDGTCKFNPAFEVWPRGRTVLVGAKPDTSAQPTKIVERNVQRGVHQGDRVLYRGRIDALTGSCIGGPLRPMALEVLNASDDEIIRLIRDYRPRRFDHTTPLETRTGQ